MNKTPTERIGWSVRAWCGATGVGRSTVYTLLANGALDSVRVGRRRIIKTRPADFLDAQPVAPGERWVGPSSKAPA